MRHDLSVRSLVRDRLKSLAKQMSAWDATPRIDEKEEEWIRESITPFDHCTYQENLVIGGVDGTGDFPTLSYSDSFIYITLAQATRYAASRATGLREIDPELEPLIEFTWLPSDDAQAHRALEDTFTRLVGLSIIDTIEASDYRTIRAASTGGTADIRSLANGLIRPHASDSGNLAIQLRSTAEFAAALRLIKSEATPDFVLVDTTFSLPFVGRKDNSLFFEHVKRLCCVEARNRSCGFFGLSKSHGLPAAERLNQLAAEKLGGSQAASAEHWFIRIPDQKMDGWSLSLLENRQVPPIGAVSYLVRFHKNVPLMRLDMDLEYWMTNVKGRDAEETSKHERRIFEALDYASHDQRAFGYPYPIKAGHDRASLTQAERLALRKMIIHEAVAAGMRPQLFRNVSQATGHG